MGGATYQRGQGFEAVTPRSRTEGGPLPRGYGLSIAAATSLGLWVGIFWLAAQVLG